MHGKSPRKGLVSVLWRTLEINWGVPSAFFFFLKERRIFYYFTLFFYLFIYWTCCGACGILVPWDNQGSNLCSLQWEYEFLTTDYQGSPSVWFRIKSEFTQHLWNNSKLNIWSYLTGEPFDSSFLSLNFRVHFYPSSNSLWDWVLVTLKKKCTKKYLRF